MAFAIVSENTTTTDGTEQTLVTDTPAAGQTYLFKIDTSAMAGSDEVEVRVKTKVRSGGTQNVALYAVYKGPQTTPIKMSIPMVEDISIQVTLKRTAGTDRAYPWKLVHL